MLFCVQRLYTMFPRLTVYFRYRDLTAEQRSRRVAQADWDPLRHFIGVLSSVAEVTMACESFTATLADSFTKLVQLSLMLLSDVVDVPKFPDVPLAVGAAAIEAYLKDFPEEDVVELDNRLYGSELIYVEETEGYDKLCTEARLAVYQLRTEMDGLFFSRTDTTKNWLQNPDVLTALLLTPGGGKMMQEVAAWLNLENRTADAVAAVERACATLLTGLEGPTGIAAVEQPARATAWRQVSEGPGSSVACERDFSVAGRLVRAEQSTLSSASVELHSFVSANADLVPSDTTAVEVLTHADAALFRARMNTFVPDTFIGVVGEGSGSGSDESEGDNDEREWGVSC
ncbi:hypothetical protein I4F81_011207 [Pyropia yezoensis]|uniref:Uncharacterized protein n=1 Tax=Pyropia yezoensis TaxID=2788 RepID=A0ACC3CEX2_PYRYE|nr:hypothetical protein I4F81_011207 [Neopyropia yezoensis]